MPRKAKTLRLRVYKGPASSCPRVDVPPSIEPVVALAPSSPLPPVDPVTAAAVLKRRQESGKKPANSKMRKKAMQIMALKIGGHDNDEIAKIVGLSVRSLRQYLWVAGKSGWLTNLDPQEQVEYNLAHKAIQNLDELLVHRDSLTGLPDKETTFETMKYVLTTKDAKVAEMSGQQNILQINIQTSSQGPLPTMRAGTMQGAPAFVEGETLEDPQPA